MLRERDGTECHVFWLLFLEHIPLDLWFPNLTEHNNYLENSGKKKLKLQIILVQGVGNHCSGLVQIAVPENEIW